MYLPNIASVPFGGTFGARHRSWSAAGFCLPIVVGDYAMLPSHAAATGVPGCHQHVRVAAGRCQAAIGTRTRRSFASRHQRAVLHRQPGEQRVRFDPPAPTPACAGANSPACPRPTPTSATASSPSTPTKAPCMRSADGSTSAHPRRLATPLRHVTPPRTPPTRRPGHLQPRHTCHDRPHHHQPRSSLADHPDTRPDPSAAPHAA